MQRQCKKTQQITITLLKNRKNADSRKDLIDN